MGSTKWTYHAIIHKISETNSSFQNSAYEKSLISDFEEFFASINKISFSKEDQALGNYSMKFRHLPDIF